MWSDLISDRILHSDDLCETVSAMDPGRIVSFFNETNDMLKKRGEFPMVEMELMTDGPDLVFFFGDIHGDLPVLDSIIGEFEQMDDETAVQRGEASVRMVFLGDYTDRAPKDVDNGGFLTLLRLLAFKRKNPDLVFLLRGNHEAFDLLPFSPYELPIELSDLFGDEWARKVNEAANDLFTSLPLFVRTPNGIIASHAAFPSDGYRDIESMGPEDTEAILETIWGDPKGVGRSRGEISRKANFDRKALTDLLERSGSNILIRGHDHNMNGHSVFDGKVLTLITSSRYKSRGAGGILTAHTLLESRVKTLEDLEIRDLSVKGWPEKRPEEWTGS